MRVDNHTIYLSHVNAYPFEFAQREREAFERMHPEQPERTRYLYVLRLLEKAGYCTIIQFPTRKQPEPAKRKRREWVTIL